MTFSTIKNSPDKSSKIRKHSLWMTPSAETVLQVFSIGNRNFILCQWVIKKRCTFQCPLSWKRSLSFLACILLNNLNSNQVLCYRVKINFFSFFLNGSNSNDCWFAIAWCRQNFCACFVCFMDVVDWRGHVHGTCHLTSTAVFTNLLKYRVRNSWRYFYICSKTCPNLPAY